MGWIGSITWLNEAGGDLFALLGAGIERKPGRTIILAYLFAIACSGGLSGYEWENDPVKLWIPKGTTIATDYNRRTALILDHNYSRTPAFEPGLGGGSHQGGGNTYIYLEAVHGSATTKAGVEKLLALWQISFGFPGFDRLQCDGLGLSILGYFTNPGGVDDGADVASMLAQHVCPIYSDHFSQISSVVTNMTNNEVSARLLELLEKEATEDSEASTPMSQIKARSTHRFLFGGIQGTSDAATPATGARVLQMQFPLVEDGEEWIEAMTGASDDSWKVKGLYANSSNHELKKMADDGAIPTACGIILMVLYVSITLGGVHRVDGMVLVGLGAVSTICVSIVAGLGLASAIGIQLNMMTPLVFLLMLGIGVDDSFVLINTFRSFTPDDTASDRVAETMREAGMSILMTSLTDIAAFAAGTLTELKAVRDFCGLAACCVATDFLLQITLFIAFLVYDRTRASKNRLWAACWVTSTAATIPVTPRQRRKTMEFNPHVHKFLIEEAHPSVRRFLVNPLLLSGMHVRLAIVLMFSGLLGGMGYGWTFVGVGGIVRDFCPFGSYMPETIAVGDEHFLDHTGSLVEITFDKLDHVDTIAAQDGILAVLTQLEASSDINRNWGGRGTQCWVRDYVEVWLPAANLSTCGAISVADAREARFWECLETYKTVREGEWLTAVTTTGVWPHFKTDGSYVNIPWHHDFHNSEPEKMMWARCWTRHSKGYAETELLDYALEMERIRTTVTDIGDAYGGFALNGECLKLSRYLGLLPAAELTAISAIVACAIVTLFFVGSFTVTFLVTTMVACINICIIGVMGFLTIRISETSMVGIIMAAGFAIDSCSHVGHSYMHANGQGAERAANAIYNSAPAVISAGSTSLLAALCMLLGGPVFVVFGKMFIAINVFGQLFALVLLPVLLSWVWWVPRMTHRHHERDQHKLRLSVMEWQQAHAGFPMNRQLSEEDPEAVEIPKLADKPRSQVVPRVVHHKVTI